MQSGKSVGGHVAFGLREGLGFRFRDQRLSGQPQRATTVDLIKVTGLILRGQRLCHQIEMGKIRRAGVDNLAVHPGDARDMMDVLPEASIDKAFLLYPDPWPKTRHHRRRFVTAEHLEPLAKCLKPGAEFRVATDIPDYVRQTLEQVPQFGFEWLAKRAVDWREPWGDWISTRYEQKALREGRVPHYLTFRKV